LRERRERREREGEDLGERRRGEQRLPSKLF
jgi:hypothetical protein